MLSIYSSNSEVMVQRKQMLSTNEWQFKMSEKSLEKYKKQNPDMLQFEYLSQSVSLYLCA